MKKIYTKGPRFNFPYLSYVSDAINQIVEWIESLPRVQEIKAGPNIYIRQDDQTCIIEATASGEGGGVAAPTQACDFSFSTFQNPGDTANKFRIQQNGGLINGLLPSGWDDIGGALNKDQTYFIYAKATSSGDGISDLTYEVVGTAKPPEQAVELNTPPDTFYVLLLQVVNGTLYRTSCNNILAIPTVYRYEYKTDGTISTYWTWSISSNFDVFSESAAST